MTELTIVLVTFYGTVIIVILGLTLIPRILDKLQGK